MRKFLALPIAALLFSCESSEEKLIKDYEQTLMGTKVDLSMKIESLEEVDKITAKDSLEFYRGLFENPDDPQSIQDLLMSAEEFLDEYEHWDASTQGTLEKTYQQSKHISEAVNGLEKYRSMGDKVLAVKYKAVYSATNPLLNTRQTIGSYYYIKPDKSEIIRSERFDL